MNIEHLIHDAKFWVASAFVLFMVVFLRYVAPPIARALDGRASKISAELEAAQRLREEAAAVLASYKEKEKQALKDAEALLVHAREEAERLKKQAEQSLKENVERRIAQANEKIARAESEAVDTIRTQIVDTAIAAVKKVATEAGAAITQEKAVKKAITEIGRIVH